MSTGLAAVFTIATMVLCAPILELLVIPVGVALFMLLAEDERKSA